MGDEVSNSTTSRVRPSSRSEGLLFGIKTAVSKMRSLIKYASAFRTEQVGPAGGVTTLILCSRPIYLFRFTFLGPLASPRIRSTIGSGHEPFNGETHGTEWFNVVCELWRYCLG